MRKNVKNLKGGYVLILNALFFIAILIIILVAVANMSLSRLSSARSFIYSKQAYITASSAASEALYRLRSGKPISDATTVDLSPFQGKVNISSSENLKRIVSTASVKGYKRDIEIYLTLGTGISFHYGIQSGRGGFVLQNTSSVVGNVFSSGNIIGASNFIYGDAISAGPTGTIDGIHATGTIYAHNIRNSIANKDAYFTTLTNSTVGGTKYPNSPDLPDAPYPISDEQVKKWQALTQEKADLCSNGSYNITSSTTLGSVKIPCDLNIVGSGGGFTVTVTGPIWVVGNITTSNKASIKMDESLGSQNVAIIADDPNASTTKGIIRIGQNTTFQDSGAANAFVFMISQNGSAENGGSIEAIEMNNGASALVAYAIHGQITLAQSVNVKEVTAYKIVLANSAKVVYDRGLPSVLFSSGPGGGYDQKSWLEI